MTYVEEAREYVRRFRPTDVHPAVGERIEAFEAAEARGQEIHAAAEARALIVNATLLEGYTGPIEPEPERRPAPRKRTPAKRTTRKRSTRSRG